jgi:NAD kinase
MPEIEKIVVITKKTALEELVERFNTREQARFYLGHMRSGVSFDEYQSGHDTYVHALAALKESAPAGMRCQFIERSFLPTFTFGEHDLVVVLGPDGLVVNTAKYLTHQPLLGINPDPQRIDGILVAFQIGHAAGAIQAVRRDQLALKQITMAKAELNDGQVIYAVNDLFIGQQSHVSARYRIEYRRTSEEQSSSGIIVSTGAGSTGWLRSIVTGAAGVMQAFSKAEDLAVARERYRFDWEASYLYFSIREPFISKTSAASIVFGRIEARDQLHVISEMPQNGVIFSDGVEADYLSFNSGAIARIGVAEKRLNLVVPPQPRPARASRRAAGRR